MSERQRESSIARLVRSVSDLGLNVVAQAAIYPLRKWWGCRRAATNPQTEASWISPGPVRSWQSQDTMLTLVCDHADVQIAAISSEIVRVRLRPDRRFLPAFSYALAREDGDWPACGCSVEETSAAVLMRTSALSVEVSKADASIRFLTPEVRLLDADAEPMSWAGERVALSRALPDDAHVYGFGGKSLPLDKRGLRAELYNFDCNGYGPGDDPLYMSIPFYVLLRNGAACGMFFDNSYRALADVGASRPDVLRLEAEGGELRYYLFAGPTPADVMRQYTELTGRIELPPLWTLGYHQNRWSYYPDARVCEVARGFRERRIPCDAIHLDIHYMDGYRCFTWHPQRFPDPPGLVRHLHERGFKVVGMIDPGIKTDRKYSVYQSGQEQNAFCKYPNGALFKGPVWPGLCCFPDFSSPRARAWWGEQYKALLDVGLDGFWNDMNEPAIFGAGPETMPDCVRFDWEGQGADFRQAHNVYGMLMVKASSEGLRRLRPDRRTLVISRSGWAGLQRYGSHWTGDNRTDWPSLANTIPMVLMLGLSGVAFTGPDTGGFSGSPSGELLTRWNQLSIFTPFFRNHTAVWTADQEPWVHGEPYESLNRAAIELRYRMLPYIYTAFWQCSQTGLPMMRPLFLAFPHDAATYAVQDEFMFGDSLLVAPVLEESANRRSVYLPAGRWYDFWSGQAHDGPATLDVDAPLDKLPLFARAGSVIPNWPVQQYVGERAPDPLTLHVFPGDGESLFYEDEGDGWAHNEGMFRLSRFAMSAAERGWTLRWNREGRFQPPYSQVEVVIHALDAPPRIQVDGQDIEAVWQDGIARVHTREFDIMRIEAEERHK
jgi:alpha-glucosidase